MFGWAVLGELFLGELSPFEVRDYRREALNGIRDDGQRTVEGKILSSGQYLAANSALP